jgi:dnd system-associated protein 4
MTMDIEKIYIDNDDRAIYDKLEKELDVKKINKKDLFMFALSTGFKKGIKFPLVKKQEFFWANNLRDDDEIIIKSIALNVTKNFDILQNHEELVKIVQEYAHGGIQIIKEKLARPGSFVKQIEKEIEEEYQFCFDQQNKREDIITSAGSDIEKIDHLISTFKPNK